MMKIIAVPLQEFSTSSQFPPAAEQLSNACFSAHWAPSGSWSWTPWQSAAARSSLGRPRPPGPWRRSSSLAGSHRKHLNAVAERQRHSGEAGRQTLSRISSRTRWFACFRLHANLTPRRWVWPLTSQAFHDEGGQLRAAGHRTQSTQVQHDWLEYRYCNTLIYSSHLVWWTDTFCTGWRSWCSWSSLPAGWQGRPLYRHWWWRWWRTCFLLSPPQWSLSLLSLGRHTHTHTHSH